MGYAENRKSKGRQWRLENSELRKSMIFKPSLKKAGLDTCWDCYKQMMGEVGEETTREIVSRIYYRHRYLTQGGYRLEFVRYDPVWLDLEFSPWVRWVDSMDINNLHCRNYYNSDFTGFMWLHFRLNSKVPYIKTPHPDILFHMIGDHVAEITKNKDLYEKNYVDRIKEMMSMSPEELELTMTMESLAL